VLGRALDHRKQLSRERRLKSKGPLELRNPNVVDPRVEQVRDSSAHGRAFSARCFGERAISDDVEKLDENETMPERARGIDVLAKPQKLGDGLAIALLRLREDARAIEARVPRLAQGLLGNADLRLRRCSMTCRERRSEERDADQVSK